MGLDDLGKLAVSNYKKWFMSINDKYDTYINDAMESMGDPFKYNNVSNTSRKSSINRLTDFLNDIQEYKENSIKRINSVFEKAQQTDGDIIDEIKPIYQQALDKINTNIENVSIYEQQLTGLKNVEKYKEGTKAFKRGFDNVRGEEIVRQEIEIERIWDKERDAQRRLYEDVNKRYTQTYHPEIENRNYYSERNSSFLDDYALKRYEDLKQMAPGMIITEQSYDWETDIDRAHELALRENNQFDFVRQSEERARRRVNNNTTRNQVNNNSNTAQSQVNTAQSQVNTAQSQVNTAQKKRRKSYADRRTKPINSEFNTTYYGQYNSQTRGYEYVDYKSHYSGGVSRSNYDMEWIDEKIFGEAHSNSEYGIEAPWSTNRTRNTNVPDTPNTSDIPDASSAPNDQSVGPKQGDAFWDNKNKRQLVYDGPDSVHGNHNFYTREGTVVNSSMDDLSPYKGKARLDYDMLKNYNTELNRFEQLTSPYFNLKYDDPETFYTDLTKNINKIDEYEKIIGSKYKSFKGNKSYHKTRAYMSDEINKYYGSEIIGEDPFNKKKNNTSTRQQQQQQQEQQRQQEEQQRQQEEQRQQEQQQQQRTIDMNDPGSWTDADIDEMAQGDPYYEDNLRKQREAALNNVKNNRGSKFNENDPTTWTDEDIAKIANGDPELADDLIELRKNAKNGILPQGPISKIGPGEIDNSIPNTYHIDAPDTEIEGFSDLGSTGRLGVVDKVMTGVNILGAVGDYKTARREGHGVVSSAVRAGAKFAVDEALGLWAIPVALVKTAPGLAIKGADMLYKENRRMNSAANFQVFGDAQFMDTQQLATMRQSGMEMAKMSQYNLQQTLMGNEATYLHR